MDTIKKFEKLIPASADFVTTAVTLRHELHIARGATSRAVRAVLLKAFEDAGVDVRKKTFDALVKAVSEAA